MKAKYCPCLGVKFDAAGRRDIAEDFGLMGLELAGTMKVYYGLKGVKSNGPNWAPSQAVCKFKLPRFLAGRVS
jgi:hypothetical protein